MRVEPSPTGRRNNREIGHQMRRIIQGANGGERSVFFLVPTGRAQVENMISPEQHEKVFNWLYDLSQNAPFDIKSTAAPMYRRVAIQRKRAEASGKPVTFQGAGFQYADGLNS